MPKTQTWMKGALAAYKSAGDSLRERGYKAMRELKDPDCGSVLTFWASARGTVIQQTWTDTGDVVFWRAAQDADDACGGAPPQTQTQEPSARTAGMKES